MTGDSVLADQVMDDYRSAALPPNEKALMDYAVKLTRTPEAMTRADLEDLRRLGYSDRALLDATHVIGYFNHINRLADALGVDLEPEMPPDPRGR